MQNLSASFPAKCWKHFKNYMEDKIREFLSESNAIEDVWGEESLNDAVEAWEYINKQEKLTIRNILKTHKILMKRQDLEERAKGNFRRVNVRVGNRICPDWRLVPSLFAQWFIQHSKAKTEEDIKNAHIELNKIHIFQDGNGRVSRIILNYQRLKANLPILIIHTGIEQMNYYKWWD